MLKFTEDIEDAIEVLADKGITDVGLFVLNDTLVITDDTEDDWLECSLVIEDQFAGNVVETICHNFGIDFLWCD